ncbi:CDP-alcohol phosphatidyltransferase family protein [Marinobacter salicampi]|uniref:CDP-alcohol phosphatidyltransferase family protein n=1 Tax=Marinobacter salicampi TaxID=435907 RepID=UPI00140B92E0|nr:CDP-alcohol phosphatidyltransferase family protein [Marinobacter salicampi]
MDSTASQSGNAPGIGAELCWGLLLLVAAWGIAAVLLSLPASILLPGVLLYGVVSALIAWSWRSYQNARDFGWANRITLVRAVMTSLLGAVVLVPDVLPGLVWPFAIASLVVLVLDGFDGAIARATHTESDFGARFDMELDAFFILLLCGAVIVLDKAGPWVVALGLMRYGFLVAGQLCPALKADLPESFRRKTVCVWQSATLLIVILPFVSPWFASIALALALALLTYSFVVDTLWLLRSTTSIQKPTG